MMVRVSLARIAASAPALASAPAGIRRIEGGLRGAPLGPAGQQSQRLIYPVGLVAVAQERSARLDSVRRARVERPLVRGHVRSPLGQEQFQRFRSLIARIPRSCRRASRGSLRSPSRGAPLKRWTAPGPGSGLREAVRVPARRDSLEISRRNSAGSSPKTEWAWSESARAGSSRRMPSSGGQVARFGGGGGRPCGNAPLSARASAVEPYAPAATTRPSAHQSRSQAYQ